jgi:hypothetical protein
LKKILHLLTFLNILCLSAPAQVLPYGVIDTADLKMTLCDFEKDANAEVLFDRAVVRYEFTSIIMERHKRVKILNEKGKKEANVRIEYYGRHGDESIKDIEAETINLVDSKIEYTPIDEKQVFTETVDKNKKAIIFTFPNVKAGSVLEFKYKWITPYPGNYPDWRFQLHLPTRYSEIDASFDKNYKIDCFSKVHQPMAKDTAFTTEHGSGSEHIWAMKNVKSYQAEPYMDYPEDYRQGILFEFHQPGINWLTIAAGMLTDPDFGQQADNKLAHQDTIIARAKTLKTNDEKIAYIFNLVKKSMTWNKTNYWFTIDGVKKAWEKKSGNSAEINLILYDLLKSANVNVYLIALSTRDHGKLNPDYPSTLNFNKTAVYYVVDSARYYVLDASNRYNAFNAIPPDIAGLQVLSIDPDKMRFGTFTIKNTVSGDATLIAGEIGADGRLTGTMQVNSAGYSREKRLEIYGDLGGKKYAEGIQNNNRGLKITSFKFENVENDTLPLINTFDFEYKLSEPDGDYIYFNPNLFTGFELNSFLSESRISSIDFGCLANYSFNGRYKTPPGYKVNVLPPPASLQMPDNSIIFRRLVSEQGGTIITRYTINYKRAQFSKDEYPSLRTFYKKIYEMLNEQIVLKKLK